METFPSLLDAARECGTPAWYVFLIGAVGLAVGLASLAIAVATANARATWVIGGIAVVLGTVAAGVGVAGMLRVRALAEKVLRAVGTDGSIDANADARFRAEARREEFQCLSVGAAASAPSVLLGLAACATPFVLRRRRSGGDPRDGA